MVAGDTVEAGLRRVLNGDWWVELARIGADDAEILRLLGRDWYVLGGCFPVGASPVAYRGGECPAFWFDAIAPSGKPTLSGAALVEAVRRVHGIGHPAGASFQPTLF